jgi:hypothetical protein
LTVEIRNNNPLDLAGADGEQITIQTTANGTAYSIAYDLDGNGDALPQLFRFTLRRNPANQNTMLLVLFFIFSNPGGGRYDIAVSGSQGGPTSHYTVAQVASEDSNTIAFTFNVN